MQEQEKPNLKLVVDNTSNLIKCEGCGTQELRGIAGSKKRWVEAEDDFTKEKMYLCYLCWQELEAIQDV